MISVNYWAVLVAAIAQIILGFLWYGPFFGKPWMAIIGITPEKMKAARSKGMGKSFVIMGIGALLMSWVLATTIVMASTSLLMYGVSVGIMAAVMSWLGFIAPVTVSPVLWESKPWKLWFINAGYYLVGLCIMGLILAVWR